MTQRTIPFLLMFAFLVPGACRTGAEPSNASKEASDRPNIVFGFADDWGYPHASVYQDDAVETPAFDRIAREGVLFTHAFVSSPSCTPSRGAVLTGQHIWRLGPAANLHSTLPAKYPVYPYILEEQANYHVGHVRKGWGPGRYREGGRDRPPAGPTSIRFKKFLKERPDDRPFCFWFGSTDPHRAYRDSLRKKYNINPDRVTVPPYLPDVPVVRNDIANYYAEVRRFNDEVARILKRLEKIGELDETVVVISGDHGWPFPRGKTQLYDSGTRVPLAIRWPDNVNAGRTINALVSLTDLAPTFLDVAGVDVPEQMTGRSLMPLLRGEQQRSSRTHWQRVFLARERHAMSQEAPETGGYPMRAIRTPDFLYIRNFAPDRWPAGTPNWKKAQNDRAWLADCDNGPTKFYIWANRNDPDVKPLYEEAFGKRPGEELYDLSRDPHQMNNVASKARYSETKKRLRKTLMSYLRSTGDPRATDQPVAFNQYPYYGGAGAAWPGKEAFNPYRNRN